MGACCSKTHDTTITSKPTPPEKNNNTPIAASPTPPQTLNKDGFILKNRKTHEIDRHPAPSIDPNKTPDSDCSKSAITETVGSIGAPVRTSSCTKEEVDAILIQCGRLSRSSSGVNPAGGETPTRGRRYSGSKRIFDFDDEVAVAVAVAVEVVVDGETHRQQQPRASSPSSWRRSRERSGSKERGSGTGGRRVSRSPNRRSESPVPNATANVAATSGNNRPGKMVSVPATDKTGGGEIAAGVVKKTQVKQTVGEAAVVAISRAANVRALNENQNPQPLTLSRGNSPYRRNRLGEIDTNVVGLEQPGSKKPNGEKTMMTNKTEQIVSRTRSSRLSRELSISPETLINPSPNPNPNPPSYASLLLEDIQNFHKNPSTCVSKASTGSDDQQLKVVSDDIMEPGLHKYVTVRRGSRGGDADTGEQESSGSNSFAGSQQLSWMLSSWESSSGDSADCWTSKSRSNIECEKSGEYPRNGIGRGRLSGQGRSAYSLPNNATFGSI
ncbi:uncharacterized protein At1g65710-like [Bidens hawaiensis]|uniref:uncharacterized protein At1g65710-like n=1 Tax=Bidens hawaiensis TaxID=980011 RepID=UPI0040493C9B